MRKNLLLIICVLLSHLSWAAVISQEEAEKKAQQFLNLHAGNGPLRSMGNKTLNLAQAAKYYYVFNIGSADGFVMVSSSDKTPAILGYSDEGQFDADDMPDNMRAWLQDYAHQLNYLEQHSDEMLKAPKLDQHAAVKPLLKSKWNQGEPYNNKCPVYNEEKTAVGCVATAMAQIVNYHKYPAKTTKRIPSYTTRTHSIAVSALPVTPIDWDNILDKYDNIETEAQKDAIATLMQLCGVAIDMDYCPPSEGGSVAYFSDVMVALKEYFDYDASTTYIERVNYKARDWDNTIYHELANNRPVFYGAQSIGGGHGFVIDGYDKDGLYHVNWGWSGSGDGYYLLSILDPENNSGIGASTSNDGYSFYQNAIINIQPNTGVAPQVEVKMTTEDIGLEQTDYTKADNETFSFNYYTAIYNYTGSTQAFELGTGIFSQDGTMLIANKFHEMSLENNYGFGSARITVNLPSLPDGTYFIANISRKSGSDTWLKNRGSDKYYIAVTIKGNQMKLMATTIDLTGQIETDGILEKGRNINVKTTIHNNGTFFNEVIYLKVNGNNIGARHFEVETDKDEELDISYRPTIVGDNELSVVYQYWTWNQNQNKWDECEMVIAKKTIKIEPAKTHNLKLSNGTVTNAKNKVINSSTAKIRLNVRNNGNYDYNDDLRIYYLDHRSDNLWYLQGHVDAPIEVAKGVSKNVDIEVPGLTDNRYWFIIVYKTNGEFYTSDRGYSELYDYQVIVPDVPEAIETVKKEATNARHQIYNLNGQKLQKAGKGIVIIDKKKIVMK